MGVLGSLVGEMLHTHPGALQGSFHTDADRVYNYLTEVEGQFGHLDAAVFDAHVN